MIVKKILILTLFAFIPMGGVMALPAMAGGQEEPAERPIQRVSDDKIRFSFADQEWVPVIEYFAEEAGFSLQKIEEPPPGTFNYRDDQEYTVMEALDVINTALVRQGYTLIRYKKLLILRPLGDVPDQLIEEITPDELDERGKFEVLRCEFDLSGVDAAAVEEDIASLVSRDYSDSFLYIAATKKLFVKETGDRLRAIRNVIEEARRESISANLSMTTYRMKHIDVESLLIIVRQFMGMAPDQNQLPDGSLSIAVQPLADRLYLSGTPDQLERFMKIAETVDAPDDVQTDYQIEKPRIATYPVLNMPEVVFQVLQTLLEGRESVRMEQDPKTGTIVVQGREEDHQVVVATIAELAKTAPGFAFITLQEADAAEVVAKLQAVFGQSSLDDSSQSGPTIIADSIINQVMVRGTPQEVELVKTMITELDLKNSYSSGPRTSERFIEMDAGDREEVMGWLDAAWGSVGRENRLNIIMPEERLLTPTRPTNSLPIIDRPELKRPLRPELDRDDTELPPREIPKATPPGSEGGSGGVTQFTLRSASVPVGLTREDKKVQETSDERKPDAKRPDYRPVDEKPSVPGDEIKVRWTEYGLILESDDLDALDDMEDLIYDRLNRTGVLQRPTVIPLNHCPVEEALSKLESILGISSGGGGGGGGGLGGMMAGVMGNALGGAAGDVLGGLLGGDTGTASAGSELEGDVRFSMDVRLNTLIVAGATDNDLDYIRELINFIDRANAPQLVDTLGDTYVIPVVHRDPTELKTIIEAQLGDLFRSSGGQGGDGRPSAEMQAQQQMMRALQQMTGGGRNRGGSEDPEAEKPKATLGVDEQNRALLVTGQEFIYLKVLDMVQKLDREELSVPKAVRMRNVKGQMDVESLGKMLKLLAGDKAELIVDGEEAETGSGNGSSGGTPPAAQMGSQNQAIQQAFQQQMMRAMQQRAQGAGGGRGGRGGGGGGRGGGGRGGRGGGGGDGGGGDGGGR